MPQLTHAHPAYRKHAASGQSRVRIDGRDIYLGPHGTAASRREYDRVVGEWLANGRRAAATADLTVSELILRFWKHAEVYYRDPDGKSTTELSALKPSLALMRRLYGSTPAATFGPLALENVRNGMIAKGWARASINMHVSRLRRVFSWGVSKQLVPTDVHVALKTLNGLGRRLPMARAAWTGRRTSNTRWC